MNPAAVRRILLLVASSSIVLGFVACRREPGPVTRPASAAASGAASVAWPAAASFPESASASAPATGAPDDRMESLMEGAFPDWHVDAPQVWFLPKEDPKEPGTVPVVLAPELVVDIDETHRVLVVRGTISDEDGHVGGGHAQPGNLGAYWFERRDDRWFVTRRRDSILWTGFMGEVGTVKPLELGGAHHAVSIENGSCWQGFCADYLGVAELDASGARVVVDGLRVATTSTGAKAGCADVLAGKQPGPHDAPDEPGPDDCFDIEGQWRIEPRADGERGDLVVAYSGTQLVPDSDNGGNKPKAVDQTLVLRYAQGAYKAASGTNPTHDF